MNISAIISSLGKKKGYTFRILIVCVIAFTILIPTLNYVSLTHNYFTNVTLNKERLNEEPFITYKIPFKVIPDEKVEDPNDWDNDGLTNEEEFLYNTDPNNNDSDLDGILDGAEVYVYQTVPTASDTDGDFICDSLEIFKYFTNPNKKDTDSDKLNDGMEIFVYKSNPFIKDSDFDHLDDFDELKIYKTDVNNPDSDLDGIKDGDEVAIYYTDPTNADTDGDGLFDLWEIENNKNPLVKDNIGRILGYYVLLPGLSLLVVIIGIVSSVGSQQKYSFRFSEPKGYLDPKLKDKQYIFDLISLLPKDKQITVNNLIEITGLSKYEVHQLLLTFFDDDNFDEASLDNLVIYTTPKSCLSLFTCFYCESAITKKMNVCPECHEEIVRCAQCQMPIEYHDPYATYTTGSICGTSRSITGFLAVEHLCEACTMKIKYDFV